MKKLTSIGSAIFGAFLAVLFIFFWFFDGYTFLMNRAHKNCVFDGAYIAEFANPDLTLVYIFSNDKMYEYYVDNEISDRLDYEYSGMYYNKGLFGKFLDFDDNWLEIDGAEQAGEFYVDCKYFCSIASDGTTFVFDESDLKLLKEEDPSYDFSQYYWFELRGNNLTLFYEHDGEIYTIETQKVPVITGKIGMEIEKLNNLYDEQH